MARMIATHTPELISIEDDPLVIADRFRENVKRLMAAQHLSQQTMAERLTVLRGKATTRSSVADILNRDHDPGMAWLELFARALDVSVTELLEESDY